MLCTICKGFDVQALFALAARRSATEKPKKAPSGAFKEFKAFPEFYKHHVGLVALRSSAENGCRLCTFLWQGWAQSLSPEIIEREWIVVGRGGEQIYLGLSKWAPEAIGYPYLAVLQNMGRDQTRNLGMYDVFAERGSVPLGYEHLLGREVQSEPDHEKCLAVATGWFTDCRLRHENCLQHIWDYKVLPTRVIDVGHRLQEPRLVVTNGTRGSWAALSYCWGGDSTFILKANNIHEMAAGIELKRFPATLRDAILVTRTLSLRYIWIDALCILQDSAEDWAAEASRMGDIYRDAEITISAGNSATTYTGMLQKRINLQSTCPLDWYSPESLQSTLVYLRSGSQLWDGYGKSSPLNKRGWTLQEALLSPRTLSYGVQQMTWECQQHGVDESGRPVAPGERYREKHFMQELFNPKSQLRKQTMRRMTAIFPIPIPVPFYHWEPKDWYKIHLSVLPYTQSKEYRKPYDRWFDIVEEYTLRNLTVLTDILPALSGLASAFQRLLGDQYCAGIWRKDILRGLMFMRSAPRPEDTARFQVQPKPNNYCIPTWSWASLPSRAVSFQRLSNEEHWDTYEKAKIIEVNTTLLHQDHFGQTSGGFLVIRAPFCFIFDTHDDIKDTSAMEHSGREKRIQEVFRRIRDLEFEYQCNHCEHAGQLFGILRLTKYVDNRWNEFSRTVTQLLIVESTGNAEDEFRRIGLYTLQNSDGDSLFEEMEKAKWKWKTVRLV